MDGVGHVRQQALQAGFSDGSHKPPRPFGNLTVGIRVKQLDRLQQVGEIARVSIGVRERHQGRMLKGEAGLKAEFGRAAGKLRNINPVSEHILHVPYLSRDGCNHHFEGQ